MGFDWTNIFGGGTTTTEQTGTQETNVAPAWSSEQGIRDQSVGGIMQLLSGLNQAQPGLFNQMFSAYFDPAARQVGQTYETARNRTYSDDAARGFGASSRQDAKQDKLTSMEGRDMADVASQSTAAALQATLAERQMRLNTLASLLSAYAQQYMNRMARSGIVTTATGSAYTPPNIGGTIGQGVGTYMGAK